MPFSVWLLNLALAEKVEVHEAIDPTVVLLKGQSQLRSQCCCVNLRLATVQAQLLAETLLDEGHYSPHYQCHIFTLGIGVGSLSSHSEA